MAVSIRALVATVGRCAFHPKVELCLLPEEEYNADTDEWTKRCACGFSITYERI